MKVGDMPSGEEFWVADKQFFCRNPDGFQEKIVPFRGQKARRLGMLAFFKQALMLAWFFFSTWGSNSLFRSRGTDPSTSQSWYAASYCCGRCGCCWCPYSCVIFAVHLLVIQLRLQAILHEPGNRLFKQILDVIHAADVCHLQRPTDLLSPGNFFGGAILSGHM